MNILRKRFSLLLALIGVFLLTSPILINGQEKSATPAPSPDDEIVRVSTTLIQTDVMVFDKDGKFIEGLKPEEFQIKVNGAPVNISFLEMVTTGSAEEKAQIAAARGGRPLMVTGQPATAITPVEGRSLFLFVDDLHLGSESLMRTRKMLEKTVDQMTANDRALIITSSGQLGYQQLTGDKAALKATIARIAFRLGVRQSIEKPEMTEIQAVAISHNDRTVMSYFINQILRTDPTLSPDSAEEQVKVRADSVIEQSAPFASNTLAALEQFAHDLSVVPGRKLLFFISDGFVIEDERSMSFTRLSGATAEAARAGVVIYSLNAQGLSTGFPDASDSAPFQASLSRSAYSADSENHNVLYSLAYDTGGRAFINNNDINYGIQKALNETSKYYLIAWRPPQEVSESGKVKRLDVSVVGRPELKVRTRKGIAQAISSALAASTLPSAGAPAFANNNVAAELVSAMEKDAADPAIPVSMVAAYRSAGATFAVKASMEVPLASLTFTPVNGKQAATVDVAGIVVDQSGKQITTFSKRINIAEDSNAVDPTRKLVFYNYDATLPPGTYRIKMGIRDTKTGKIGSASQEIVVPEISNGKLALSSLMLNEITEAADEDDAGEKVGVRKGVAQRFSHDARLRFLVYAYNAVPVAANDNEPDLKIDAQILRGTQPILSPALREVIIERGTDARTYPYVGEISLTGLQPGSYTLRINVTDTSSKATAAQDVHFLVD